MLVFEFDEHIGTLLSRAKLLGMDLQAHIDARLLDLRQLDPATLSPGSPVTVRLEQPATVTVEK